MKKIKDNLPSKNNCSIAIVGMGYVGLPLAIEFNKASFSRRTGEKVDFEVIGFDLNKSRIDELKKGIDKTNEITPLEFKNSKDIFFTTNPEEISKADIFIVTVPTPIDKNKQPDLNPIKSASECIGLAIKKRELIHNKKSIPVIIYESTVYPGLTEEICVPILEYHSRLSSDTSLLTKCFAFGYSPERINPGDKNHKLSSIIKVTSGNTTEVGLWIDNLYGTIIKAGTYLAKSIRIAEASKIIENTQRDINIALMNELSMIFKKLNIDTNDVLEAAETKWNFLSFKPGLVGGHCIGVDPYYLQAKAEDLGFQSQIILAGRKINDNMALWISNEIKKEISLRCFEKDKLELLVLGITFKENCPDMRNSKVIDLIEDLSKFGIKDIKVVDPLVDKQVIKENFQIDVLSEIPKDISVDIAILSVPHKQFNNLGSDFIASNIKVNGFVYDLKGILPRSEKVMRL